MFGVYEEYKQSTTDFVSWINRVSNFGKSSKKKGKASVTLRGIKKKVQGIVKYEIPEGFFLSPLWEETPRALKAGRVAVERRTEVHEMFVASGKSGNYFDSNDRDIAKANQQHFHCIEVLKECSQLLSDWYEKKLRDLSTIKAKDDKRAEEKDTDEQSSSNMQASTSKFSGLNEQFDEQLKVEDSLEETVDEEMKIPTGDDFTIEDTDLHFGELRLTIICLLLDLKTASKAVADVWSKVKKEETSVFAAVMVTYMAMKMIRTISNQMQLLYPSYKTARDFLSSIKGYLGKEAVDKLAPPGSLLNEFFRTEEMIGLISENYLFLETSTSTVTDMLRMCGDSLLPRLDYERGYMEAVDTINFDDTDSLMRFLVFELMTLKSNRDSFESMCDDFKEQYGNEMPEGIDPKKLQNQRNNRAGKYPLLSMFIQQFDQFLLDKKITLSLTFAIYCWLKSVQSLEDRDMLTMTKTNYLNRHYLRQRFETFKDSNIFLDYDRVSHGNIDILIKGINEGRSYNPNFVLDSRYDVEHNNPYLSGAITLSQILRELPCSTFFLSGHCIAMSHLFLALDLEGFLHTQIDVLWVLYDCFKDRTFLVDRAPSRGEYFKNYLLSRNWSIQKIKEWSSEKPSIKPAQTREVRKLMKADELSKLFSLVNLDDGSQLFSDDQVHGTTGRDMKSMLDKVEEQTNYEVFTSRYLSMDLVKWFERLYEFFEDLKESILAINLRFTQMYELGVPRKLTNDEHFSYVSTKIDTTMEVILSFLDRPVEDREPFMIEIIEDVVKQLEKHFNKLKNGKDLISLNLESFYGTISSEEELFTLRRSLKGTMNYHFGPVLELGKDYPNLNEDKIDYFSGIGRYIFEKKLSDEQATKETKVTWKRGFKVMLSHCPEALGMIQTDSTNPYPTLLDHALFNPSVKDHDLAEWIIAAHGSIILTDDMPIQHKTLLQRAVIEKNLELCMQLLMVDRALRNVNYQCKADGNTALHYAAMHTDRSFFNLLLKENADYLIKNYEGKTAIELLNDGDFKQTMKDYCLYIFTYKSVHAMFKREERLERRIMRRRAIDAAREEETIQSLKQDERATINHGNDRGKKKGGSNRNKIERFTKEDERKAEEAARQLLELLEEEGKKQGEEKDTSTKKKKQQKGRGGGGQKK